MPEYVRVKDKSTGHHYTVLAQEATNNPDAYQVLKQPAVNENGDPLPGEIPESTTAAPKKTAAKKTAAKKSASTSTPTGTTQGQQATDNTQES